MGNDTSMIMRGKDGWGGGVGRAQEKEGAEEREVRRKELLWQAVGTVANKAVGTVVHELWHNEHQMVFAVINTTGVYCCKSTMAGLLKNFWHCCERPMH